ncbi:MAG: sodium:calcium antiporter [Thermoplasmata archaeon]|nr:sodium:calcium antiporter [Thermoplasmata archaeon]
MQVIDLLTLLIPLFVILIGCELFTNGIEWMGLKLGLAESATGSVLAAVGTALPETTVPIVAIVFATNGAGEQIATGAILGAPFMLATLAMFVGGIAVYLSYKKGKRSPELRVDRGHVSLDIWSFLLAYSIAVAAALFLWGDSPLSHVLRYSLAVVLLILYAIYVRKMIRDTSKKCDTPECLHFFRPFPRLQNKSPSLGIVSVQVLASLGMIIVGAKIFVSGIELISTELGISTVILAFLIAPVATELPEKFNSVLWYWRGKDTLALGNITGAMVFQSSIPVSIGIIFTDWVMAPINLLSMFFAIGAIFLIYAEISIFKKLTYKSLLISGIFYLIYILLIFLVPSSTSL